MKDINNLLRKGKRKVLLEIPEDIEFTDRDELFRYILISLKKNYEIKEDKVT